MDSRVIVAHPGQQHSYRLASALKHAFLLDSYITTVYYRSPASLLGIMAYCAPGDNGERIRGRHNPDLDNTDVRQFYQLRGIAETLLYRLPNPGRFDSFFYATKKKFGIRVAKEAIRRNVDAVVCYDTNALEAFQYLRQHAPRIARVLDVSSVPSSFRRHVYEQIMADAPDPILRDEESGVWNHSYDERLNQEVRLADYCLAPSGFVSKGLIYAGADAERILRLPYGSNFPIGAPRTRSEQHVPTFLFVGQCRVRKGLRVIAEALRDPNLLPCRLTIVGQYDAAADYMIDLLQNERVNVLGAVSRNRVAELCREADAFVFPTYNEGMSLACLEAMASGLPIIATPNAGIEDLVTDGVTGYTIPCGQVAPLVKAMNALIQDPDGRVVMGNNALEVAKRYTWSAYEDRAKVLFENRILRGRPDAH